MFAFYYGSVVKLIAIFSFVQIGDHKPVTTYVVRANNIDDKTLTQ